MLRIFLCIILLYSQLNVFAQTVRVCKTCELKTLQAGIAQAKSGDTLHIEKGIYKEHEIVIDKPLTIIGKDYPVIDGEMIGEIIRVISDSVTIDGLFIKNVGTSYTSDFAAIRIKRSKHFLIQNLKLETLFFGIYLEKSDDGIIQNNYIKGDAKVEYQSGNGIHLWHCKNVQVLNNKIYNVRDGIYFEFVYNSLVQGNVSINNLRYGLHFMFSNNDVYRDNYFEDNGAGVAVMFSKFIKIENNTFKKNKGAASYGLLLKEINDATISNNIFQENTIGTYLEGCNRITYANNNLLQNGWALKMMGACFENKFIHNNFIGNTFDVSYSGGNTTDNRFDYNYWSEYAGYDLNKDGTGDVPFRPVKLFSFITTKVPESIILIRSSFVDLVNFSEKVSPVFTPEHVSDSFPSMHKF